MIDRIPVNILENGAIKYGIYDESGNLFRYEYIKNEDGAVTTGTALNKANLLSDAVAAAIKLATEQTSNPETVSSALGLIAGVVGTNGVRIAAGSYTGNGLYGSSHPCSLTFDFVPKVVIISDGSEATDNGAGKSTINSLVIMFSGQASFKCVYYTYDLLTGDIPIIWSGKTVSWYFPGSPSNNVSDAQRNSINTTYRYLALG